jgi:hypothetical protein
MSDVLRQMTLASKVVVCGVVLVLCVPRGAEAQLSDILNIVENIQSRVGTIESRVSSAITQAQAARLAAEEVRTQVREGVDGLTPELREFIDSAISEARTVLEQETAGLDAFAPGGSCGSVCEAFRTDLVASLTGSADFSAAILESTGNPAVPDLSEVISVLQLAPPRLLYPLYRVLQGAVGASLSQRLNLSAQETRAVVPMTTLTTADACTVLVQNADRIQRWSTGAMTLGALLKVVGGVVKVLGETQFSGEVGIAGFVSGTITSNKRKQLGEAISTVATVIDQTSTFAANKVRSCLLSAFQVETQAALATIQDTLSGLDVDLTNLDQPVSTRATQVSVDAVQTTLQGVAGDVALLLEQHGENPGQPGRSLTLRVQIERQMVSGEHPLSVFYMPESFGGLLETVRTVVEHTLAQHQAAGFPVTQALHFLSKGDQALASLDYRAAYAWYQHAYQRASVGHRGDPRKDGR